VAVAVTTEERYPGPFALMATSQTAAGTIPLAAPPDVTMLSA
jgi:hypothetical protein